MRNLLFIALCAASGTASANFCAIDNFGNSRGCNFGTLQQCQQFIGNQGACTVAVRAGQPVQQTYQQQPNYGPDIAGAYQQGQAAAAARKESAARTALLEAQAAEVRARSAAPAQSCPVATYKCQAANGQTFYAQEPIVGCTVLTVN